MTEAQKDILIKDLCARLPYGVKVKSSRRKTDVTLSLDIISDFHLGCNIKPFLRPMSSMTEEELNEYENFIINEKDYQIRFCKELVFYNRHHFDYRGLIEKGLAIEASEGMYKKGE